MTVNVSITGWIPLYCRLEGSAGCPLHCLPNRTAHTGPAGNDRVGIVPVPAIVQVDFPGFSRDGSWLAGRIGSGYDPARLVALGYGREVFFFR